MKGTWHIMERRAKGLILLLSILLLIFLVVDLDFGQSGVAENYLISEEEYQEIISSRELVEEPTGIRVSLNDYPLPQDQETADFLYSIDLATFDLEQLEIEVSANRRLNYDFNLVEKEITKASLQQNEILELIFYNDEEYVTYAIHLTTLPIVEISLDYPRSEERPIETSRQKGKLKLFTNDASFSAEEQRVESDMYINLRGATSRAFPKNQYRINLREFTIGGDEKNNHLSLVGLREDDDYILYAAYNDPAKARNIFANNLWKKSMGNNNRFDIENGVEGKYVEVFIENRYWGLYGLTYPHDNKTVDLQIGKEASESEFYYRTVSNIPFDFEAFERTLGNNLAMNRFEIRELDEPYNDSDQWQPIYEYFSVLHRGTAEDLAEYLKNSTDLGNQIDYYLFVMLLQATDNNFKNHNYISKFDGSQRIMIESPWDLDLTFGLRWNSDSDLLASLNEQPEWNYRPSETMIYKARELGVPGIDEQIIDRYLQLRLSDWSNEAINDMLAEFEEAIYHSGAIHRDKDRWENTAYHETIDQFSTYVLQRLEAMDQLLLEGER